MSVEDRLRTADQSQGGPGHRDPPARPARPRADPAAPRTRPPPLVAWAAPAAAAALVVALAVTLVSIRQARNESSVPVVATGRVRVGDLVRRGAPEVLRRPLRPERDRVQRRGDGQTSRAGRGPDRRSQRHRHRHARPAASRSSGVTAAADDRRSSSRPSRIPAWQVPTRAPGSRLVPRSASPPAAARRATADQAPHPRPAGRLRRSAAWRCRPTAPARHHVPA